jgi:hypothetical protein
MRTEEDLRNAFDRLADSAPDPSHVLTVVGPRPVRRRPLVLGAVLATTAAVIAVPLIVSHDKQPPVQSTTAPANEAWRDRLSLPLPANLIYDERGFGRSSQTITLDGGNTRTTCFLTAYAKGAFDAGKIPPGSPRVRINNVLGYVALLADPFSPATAKKRWIVWEPAPNTWTTSYCNVAGQVDPAKATEIARSVNTSPQRLPAPYRIGYLPAGLSVTTLSVNPQNTSTSEVPNNFIADLGTEEPAPRTPGPIMLAPGGPARISYLTGPSATRTSLPVNAERIIINGRTAYLGKDGPSTVLAIKGDGFQVRIELGGGAGDRPELIKIAKGLELAPSATDTSSWFDATTAIP